MELDAQVVFEIQQKLKESVENQPGILYQSNASVYQSKNTIFYFGISVEKHQIIHYELNKVEENGAIAPLLEFCQKARSIGDICDFLQEKFPDIERQDCLEFAQELIQSTLLISTLDRCYFEINPLQYLKGELNSIDSPSGPLLQNLLHELNSNTQVNCQEVFAKVVEQLAKMDIEIDPNEVLFHAKSIRCSEEAQPVNLSQKLLNELIEARRILSQLFRTRNDQFENFKTSFEQRYGQLKMPLLEVMNPLSGLGYTQGNESVADLEEVKGITANKNPSRNLVLTALESQLLSILQQEPKKKSIDLKDVQLLGHPPLNFKSSLAFTTILDNGKSVLLQEFTELSASRYINRFAPGHPELAQFIEDKLVRFETQAYEKAGVLPVEFVHIPEVRMGNLLQYEHHRPAEINCVYPGKKDIKQIQLEDLDIQLIEGQFILTSRSLNQVIQPMISNSINPNYSPINVYNFLFDLQGQNEHFDLFYRWGGLENILQYFPRIQFKNVIFSPASWKLSFAKVNSHDALVQWLEENELPNRVWVSKELKSDEKFVVDLNSSIGLEILLQELERKSELYLSEILGLENAFVQDENGAPYQHELLIPLINYKYQANRPLQPSGDSSKIKERFLPGDEWLFFKIYCANDTVEKLLQKPIGQLMHKLKELDLISKSFFIRYGDPSFHLRLRFEMNENASWESVLAITREYLKPWTDSGEISKIVLDSYEREINRYHPQTIEYCEDLFSSDSQLVQQFLENYPDRKFDFCLLGIDHYLDLFEFDLKQKCELLELTAMGFFREHGGKKELKLSLDKKYRDLSKRMTKLFLSESDGIELKSLLSSYTAEMKLGADQILNAGLDKDELNGVIESLIHMFLNRVLTSNPRYNEMFIYAMLSRQYEKLKIFEEKQITFEF